MAQAALCSADSSAAGNPVIKAARLIRTTTKRSLEPSGAEIEREVGTRTTMPVAQGNRRVLTALKNDIRELSSVRWRSGTSSSKRRERHRDVVPTHDEAQQGQGGSPKGGDRWGGLTGADAKESSARAQDDILERTEQLYKNLNAATERLEVKRTI